MYKNLSLGVSPFTAIIPWLQVDNYNTIIIAIINCC